MNICKIIFGSLIFILSCAAPRTNVQTDNQNGTILFKVIPAYADVYIDGKHIGKVREFNGEKAILKLSSGKYVVTIKAEGYLNYEKRIYLSDTQEIFNIQLRKVND